MDYSHGNKPIVPTINSCRASSSEAATPSDVLRLQASSPLPPIKENGTSPPSDKYVAKRYLFDSPVPNKLTSDKHENSQNVESEPTNFSVYEGKLASNSSMLESEEKSLSTVDTK